MSEPLTNDQLLRVLTRYEGAVNEVEREGNDEAIPELEAARADLMALLRSAKATINV